ncbi:MAG: methyltransferase domain-containing protein [Anaerolineae bacterium]|nr:methyltransferase domain-containing protein [Anaerolineae bacterium]
MCNNHHDTQEVVKKAREGFSKSWLNPVYSQLISDAEHLANILDLCEMVPGQRYLDIGTGNGYIAFEVAHRHPEVLVTGIDIVEEVIEANTRKAQENDEKNLVFATFDGICYPFSDNLFRGAMSRYAFHHFPLPDLAAREIYRVLEPGGFCVIADPMADPADEVDFVNRFAALRDDGHVRYYRKSVLVDLFEKAGFTEHRSFSSAITFPRPNDARYKQVLDQTAGCILDLYRIRVEGEQIYITVQVMNICFVKPATAIVPKG